MSDEQLRQLERRWRETQSVQDHAKYLAERVRTGELTETRLLVAAYCDDKAARLATGQDTNVTVLPTSESQLRSWVGELDKWGAEVSARAAIAAATVAANAVEAKYWDLVRAPEILDAARAWLACPCEDHSVNARRLAQSDEAARERGRAEFGSAKHRAASAVWSAAMAVRSAQKKKRMSRKVNEAAEAAVRASQAVGASLVVASMTRDLVLWALGTTGAISDI